MIDSWKDPPVFELGPLKKKKKKSDCSLYAYSVTDSKLCNWSVRPKKHFKH